jgi:hypothetical protein
MNPTYLCNILKHGTIWQNSHWVTTIEKLHEKRSLKICLFPNVIEDEHHYLLKYTKNKQISKPFNFYNKI